MKPLAITTHFDREGERLPPRLTPTLKSLYGGGLSFPVLPDRPYVIGNFVQTLDGVASYNIPGQSGGGPIAGVSEEDRFLMGLLRSYADAVVVGSGTLHGDPGHVRIPEFIYPEAKVPYSDFRRILRKSRNPINVIVTGSGKVDLKEPTFHTPYLETLIVTTNRGMERLHADHGNSLAITTVRAVSGGESVAPQAILELLGKEFGVRLLLHEGGPRLFGEFLTAGLLDELFLTFAPQVAGRAKTNPRPSFAEEAAFLPETAPWFRLVSVKSAGDHLLLRLARRRNSGNG